MYNYISISNMSKCSFIAKIVFKAQLCTIKMKLKKLSLNARLSNL